MVNEIHRIFMKLFRTEMYTVLYLRMLVSMKGQLARHLAKNRFLASDDFNANEANINSNNEPLVRNFILFSLNFKAQMKTLLNELSFWPSDVSILIEIEF